jgi:hypothetical protein
LVDEATSPLQLSLANINTDELPEAPVTKQKKMKNIQNIEEVDDQEIYAVSQASGDISLFPSPYVKPSYGLTRVEKARLLNAGFPSILDEDGHRPVTISSSLKGLSMNWELERKDLRYNDISFTFMGLTFNDELFHHFGGYFPQSIFFTLQFYDFAPLTTERLSLYTGPLPPSQRFSEEKHHRSTSVPPSGKHTRQWSHVSHHSSSRNNYLPEETKEQEHLWPGIFFGFEEDGTPNCKFTDFFLKKTIIFKIC